MDDGRPDALWRTMRLRPARLSRGADVAVLALVLALILVQAACRRESAPAADAGADPAMANRNYTIDEDRLLPVSRFDVADLDAGVDACEDFARHVNGKWLARHPIPDDRISWGPWEVLKERSLGIQQQLAEQAAARAAATGVDKIVGDFYATGMDGERIEAQGLQPLAGRLAEIDALDDGAAVAAYLRRAYARGDGQLFDFGARIDFRDSSMVIAHAGQGGLGLPDRSYYLDDDRKDELAAYEKHIAEVLELSGVAFADAEKQAEDVIAFESRLAKASKPVEALMRDWSLMYNPIGPADADRLTPGFAWSAFFESQGLQQPEMFSLAIPEFHQEVGRMIGEVPVEQWQSYLRFHLVDGVSPYLGEAFAQEHFDFHHRQLHGQAQAAARWKRVLGAIEEHAGEALGQLYVEVAFPPESRDRVERLVQGLRDALAMRIRHLDWMGPDTREKALEKSMAFSAKIGYPDKWRDWSGLQTSRESYLGNVLAAREFNYRWSMSMIGKPIDRTLWLITPQTVNARFWPNRNEIMFPAAVLQPPIFDPEADEAYNHGGIGMVIGHEMIHGYDDQGSRFGATGNFENWWSDADREAFERRTAGLVEQFDAYEALPGKHVNGKLTLGENIADLGGLAVAYDAMRRAMPNEGRDADGLGRDQRFFISHALFGRTRYTPETLELMLNTSPHPPDRFRVIGPLSNMGAFAQAFGCEAGDSMVREGDERIRIW